MFRRLEKFDEPIFERGAEFIWDFTVYQTMFHRKTALFAVYKGPLRIKTVVIKLNEIKLKCLKFYSLNSVTFCDRKK